MTLCCFPGLVVQRVYWRQLYAAVADACPPVAPSDGRGSVGGTCRLFVCVSLLALGSYPCFTRPPATMLVLVFSNFPPTRPGAEEHGVNIQYCMPYPRHVLQSVEVPAVTQIRSSNDYHLAFNQVGFGLVCTRLPSLSVDGFGLWYSAFISVLSFPTPPPFCHRIPCFFLHSGTLG